MRSWREHLFQKLCQSMTSVTDTVSVNAAVSLLAQARRHTDKCYAKEMFNSISKQAGDLLRTRDNFAKKSTVHTDYMYEHIKGTCRYMFMYAWRRHNDEIFHIQSVFRNEVIQ